MDTSRRLEIEHIGQLWEWLCRHHADPQGVWLVTFKKAAGARYVDRFSVLDALIAYGWIDGRRMVLDDLRTMQLITPRQQQIWAQTYKDRAERLETEGRLHAPGAAAIARAKAAGLWNAGADIDALMVPDDLRLALDKAGGSAWFDAAAPSYRRNVLRWLAGAKQPATRAKRAAIIADHAARGQKVPQY